MTPRNSSLPSPSSNVMCTNMALTWDADNVLTPTTTTIPVRVRLCWSDPNTKGPVECDTSLITILSCRQTQNDRNEGPRNGWWQNDWMGGCSWNIRLSMKLQAATSEDGKAQEHSSHVCIQWVASCPSRRTTRRRCETIRKQLPHAPLFGGRFMNPLQRGLCDTMRLK